MIDKCRKCAPLLVIFATVIFSAVCAEPLGSVAPPPPETPAASGPTTVNTRAEPDGLVPTRTPDAAAVSPAYMIAQKYRPGKVSYYVIENEVRDGGLIMGLGYSTTVKDKRTIIQRVLGRPSTAPGGTAARHGGRKVAWECERYEVSEVQVTAGKRQETTFDSLRHTYPPSSLRELGKIPGSRCTFTVDPRTGEATGIKITPAKITGRRSRKKLTKTAQRCDLTQKTFEKLLFDLGPYFLPKTPKRVGERWTRTQREVKGTIGTTVTELDCTLRDVRDRDGRKIATIDLSGKIMLEPAPASKPAVMIGTSWPAASRPASSRRAASRPTSFRRPKKPKKPAKQRQFKIQRAVCAGTAVFDLTRGELVTLTLRRELDCVAEFGQTEDVLLPMKIQTTTADILRVTVTDTPPPKPVIVGGPKPPPGEPERVAKPKAAARKRSRPTTRRSPNRVSRRRTTTQAVRDGIGRRPTTRPRPRGPAGRWAEERRRHDRARRLSPTSRPASRDRPTMTNRPTSGPVSRRPHASTQPTTRPAGRVQHPVSSDATAPLPGES